MFKRLSKNQRTAAIFGLIAVIIIAYVFLFYQPMQARIARYDTKNLEKRLKAEQAKAEKMSDMQDSIQTDQQANVGTVQPYDNLKNEVNALHDILAGTGTYKLEFDEAVKTGNTVRRNFTITYDPDVLTYDAAAKIATDLYHCDYRCLVRTIKIDPTSHQGTIECSFIETTRGSTTTAGLSNGSDDNSSSSGNGAGLSGSDMSGTIATRQD